MTPLTELIGIDSIYTNNSTPCFVYKNSAGLISLRKGTCLMRALIFLVIASLYFSPTLILRRLDRYFCEILESPRMLIFIHFRKGPCSMFKSAAICPLSSFLVIKLTEQNGNPLLR